MQYYLSGAVEINAILGAHQRGLSPERHSQKCPD